MHGPGLPSEGFLGRLKSHKVIQWTLAYAALAYTVLHGVEMVAGALSWPHWIVRVLTLLLILGVPVIALLAWYHGQQQLKRVSGAELVMISLLGVIAGSVLWGFSGTGEEHKTAQAEQRAPATSAPVATPTATEPAHSTPVAPRTAVAVLPFANLTGDASKEYLGDGMAEELINTLTKVQGLKVPARTSTFAYKGRNADIRQIAKDLGVGTILEGSVRAAGKRLRITAQLINAQDGLHLWSETYDEEFTDIFKLQDKLAKAIVQALQVNLGGASGAALEHGAVTSDVEAYNLYLQGNALIQSLTPDNLSHATELCRRAVMRDPDFARGYDCIANAQMSYVLLPQQSYEHFATAEEAARKALALDSTLTDARLAISSLAGFRGQWAEMEARDRSTAALASNDAKFHLVYSYHLYHVGRTRDALREVQLAYTLAPASPQMVASLANNLWIVGDTAHAERYTTLAQELGLSPRNVLLRATRIEAALQRQRYDEASAVVDDSFDRSDPDWSKTAELHKLAFAALAGKGNRDAVLKARDRLYPRSTKPAPGTMIASESCSTAAMAFVYLDEIDAAYDLLDQCLAMLKPPYVESGDGLSKFWSPPMRRLRESPRFQALATRVGWMDNWLQYGFPDGCEYKSNKLMCH